MTTNETMREMPDFLRRDPNEVIEPVADDDPETYGIVTDNFGSPSVAKFVAAKLAAFDLSMVDWFKLCETRTSYHSGRCKYPVRTAKHARTFKSGFRITVNARPGVENYETSIAVGTEKVEPLDFEGTLNLIFDPNMKRTQQEANRGWRYILRDVTFFDSDELLVFVAGHEAFHFLRKSKQVPGRNTEPSANLYGLEWLKEWRKHN